MKYSSKDFGAPPEVDWTPMIDMTFQLIAFFMFTLSFVDSDMNERVKLPSSDLARPPETPLEKPLTLQIAITRVVVDPDTKPPKERIVSRTAKVLYAGEELSVSAMRQRLIDERDLLVRQGGKPENVTVIIRADTDARRGEVQQLIQICQEQAIGFEKFVLRAENKG